MTKIAEKSLQGKKFNFSFLLDVDNDVKAIMADIHKAAEENYAKYEELKSKLESSFALNKELEQKLQNFENRNGSILQTATDLVAEKLLGEKKKIKMEIESTRELLKDLSERHIPDLKTAIEEETLRISEAVAGVLNRYKPVHQAKMRELISAVEALYTFWPEVVTRVLSAAETGRTITGTNLLNLKELDIGAPQNYFERQNAMFR